jgi:23S rRNA (uracil1939-C5)-methyltransferase
VARVDGLTLLVARGVPAEEVTVEVERTFPRYALARVVAVRRAALARVEPPCPHFAECGGCDWQHVDYPAQLGIKRAVLAEQLERIGGQSVPEVWALIPAPAPLAYRDKLDFVPVPVPAEQGGGYAPAFHGLDGERRVPIAHCRLAPEPCTRLAQALLDALVQAGTLPPGAGGAAAPAALQRLTVQTTERPDGTPGLAVLLHLRGVRGASEGRLRRTWQQAAQAVRAPLQAAFPELAALALHFPARMAPSGLRQRGARHAGARRSGPTVHVAWGPARLIKRVHGRAYRVPHAGFFQVHLEQAGALVAYVTEQAQALLPGAAGPAPDAGGATATAAGAVYDLYGGVGLFALPLAERGHRVLGADSDREGLRAAEETVRGLGLAGCVFQRADLEQPGALDKLIAAHGAPALVLCDPPRRGLAAPLVASLLAAAPPAIVYVSCDGGTFARDAARLAPAYALKALRGFDLFPQTHHLEVVGTFVRRD